MTLLRKDISIFDIIITEQRLLGISEFELLRIGREKGLPVVGKYTQLVQFLQYVIYILTIFIPFTKTYMPFVVSLIFSMFCESNISLFLMIFSNIGG